MKMKRCVEKPNFNLPVSVEFYRYGTEETCFLESADEGRSHNNFDIDSITDICSKGLVYDYLFNERFKGKQYTKKGAKDFISWAKDGWRNKKYFVFLIRNFNREIVAAIDIKSNNLESAEVGYWSSPENPGVMTNAVITLCKIAKEAGYRELYGLTVPKNIRSHGVLTRAGFNNLGEFEEKGKTYIKFSKPLI